MQHPEEEHNHEHQLNFLQQTMHNMQQVGHSRAPTQTHTYNAYNQSSSHRSRENTVARITLALTFKFYIFFIRHKHTYTLQIQLNFTLISWDMFDLFTQNGKAYLVARALGACSAACQTLRRAHVYASAVLYCLYKKKNKKKTEATHSSLSFTKKIWSKSHDAFVFHNITYFRVTKTQYLYSAIANITWYYWLNIILSCIFPVKNHYILMENQEFVFYITQYNFSQVQYGQVHEQTQYKDQFWFLVAFK